MNAGNPVLTPELAITATPDAEVYIAAAKQRPTRLPTDTPVAWAVPDRNRLLVLRCPYCQERHTHGPAYGTRVSHCHRGEYALCPPPGTCITGGLR